MRQALLGRSGWTACALLAVSAWSLAVTGVSAAPAHAADPLPNVVVIMVDDQSIGQLDAMPYVQANIFDQGTDLINGMVPTSLCCPSRSSFFTGDYAHTTGVWTNKVEKNGGYTAFEPYEPDTITVALKQAGYYTGLVGKYMNDYNKVVTDVTHVPVGWDKFEVLEPDNPDRDGAYY